MLLFSGTTDISFIDPVVIGRNVFSVTNDFVSGVAGYIQDVLCAILDVILDTIKGRVPAMISRLHLICLAIQCIYFTVAH